MKRIFFITFFMVSQLYTQISQGGKPHYLNNLDIVPTIKTKLDDKLLFDRNNMPKYFIYGDEYIVDIDFFDEAVSYPVLGGNVYLLKIKSKGAQAIGLEMDRFFLSQGVEMFVYSIDRQMTIGSFNSQNNKIHKKFSTTLVKGDEIVIEIFIPFNVVNDSFIEISKIIHDFTDLLNFNDLYQNERNSCNTNVACAEGEPFEDQINSVVLMTMGGGTCSASLINNVEEDLTPYVLTAEHCLSGNANNYNFYFKYQSTSCNGSSGSYQYSMTGSSLRAVGEAPDFALLELNTNPPISYDAFYNGWSNSSSSPNDVYGIHHAGGGIKKISFTEDNIQGQYNFWVFQYDDGRIYPGSSGSPLFDHNNRTIGPSSHMYTDYCYSFNCYCDQQYDVGYGRLNRAWEYGSNSSTRLKDWLDPENTGLTFIDGTYDGFNPEMSLSSPNGSEVWDMGQSYDIAWTDNIDDYVSIKLYKNGMYILTISSSTPSDGSFQWNVPLTLIPGNDYKIKVSSLNDASVYDYSDQNFSIDGELGEVIIGFDNINPEIGTIDIIIQNTINIAGFQFDITDTPDVISLVDADGGVVSESDFLISTNETGTVLAFSLTGTSIPTGQHLLTTVSFSVQNYNETELCLENGIFSSVDGLSLPITYQDCITIQPESIVLGDINFDGEIDVIDIIELVNEILNPGHFNNLEFLAADINYDLSISILDIIALNNIILGL